MANPSKKTRPSKRERTERRFEPQSTAPPVAVGALGAVGALALGAGAYGQVFRAMALSAGQPMPYAQWILAGGAALTGIAIWIGTSGDAAAHVGDGGVGVDKGTIRRIPWHDVESVRWEGSGSGGALVVRGKDDAGSDMTITLSAKGHAQAVAWALKEARARIPDAVDVGEAHAAAPHDNAGQLIVLEPLQVVGKRCAESGKVLAYEPDARVCPRCERVYHKAHVPDACRCGASLTGLRGKKSVAVGAEAGGEAPVPSVAPAPVLPVRATADDDGASGGESTGKGAA